MANVKIYSTPECPYCKAAKEFFDKTKVKYTNIDVSSNQKAAEEMVKKSGQMGVPVIDIDGEIVIGFDENKIKETLNLK